MTIDQGFLGTVWRNPPRQGVAAAREFFASDYPRTRTDAQPAALLATAERRLP